MVVIAHDHVIQYLYLQKVSQTPHPAFALIRGILMPDRLTTESLPINLAL